MSLWGKTDTSGDEPKFTSHHEGMDTSNFTVFGVDATEQGVANAASGDARKYAPQHAGWVGITTYNDMHGNLRVKTETLVAMGSLTGDQNDDTILPDV
jgi:hypothetical protein|tara:strand:- start:189 stop:482 length:294 start_codon:yes stop_codon:yes gene_type:complete